MVKYANIIVNISHENVDHPFSYRIPESLVEVCKVGMRVNVPFGKGNRLISGYIIEIADKTKLSEDKIKDIASIAGEQTNVEENMIALARYIKEQYGSTMIAALKTVLPIKQKYQPKEKKTIELVWDKKEAGMFAAECKQKHYTGKERILNELMKETVLDYQLVTKKLNVAPSTLQSLLKDGVIKITKENYFRNPVVARETDKGTNILNEEQQSIINQFRQDYEHQIAKTYLLHGVTGSGKTEVYIKMIQKVVESKRQVIVLIPEIALTYQTLLRFYKHFKDRVSVMNSTLSPGEKYDQFQRAKNGEIDIILGPRSALFTPFQNIGLIILDEEHENSYKSEAMPRYHAREVAREIARMHGASVVLGSATPSIESYYHAKNGDYTLFTMKKRATGALLPKVDIVDLRKELKEGNRSIFSRNLQEKIRDRLNKKEQIMLFINRRGYAGFVSCRACGHVMKCPHCDVSLSEHRNGKLICHYCGFEMMRPSVCPKCKSKYLLSFRAGTEQIEEQVKILFPNARTLRMDGDTTRKKDSYDTILSAFADKKADILIGTQMIVKGHDFKDVTLVGVLAADLSLAANDYRAGERTFELLTQAAGRAGRGDREGEVVIQTYQPDHYSIIHAANQDYEGFYEEEITYRELSSYPPVYDIMAVMIMAKEEEKAKKLAILLKEKACECIKKEEKQDRVSIIGPAPAGISKLNDYYRYVFYGKSKEKEELIKIKDQLEEELEENKELQVYFDFNPMNPY